MIRLHPGTGCSTLSSTGCATSTVPGISLQRGGLALFLIIVYISKGIKISAGCSVPLGFHPPGRGNPLEKGLEIHAWTLAWEIPQTEESGRLQSMGWQRVDMTSWPRTVPIYKRVVQIISKEIQQTRGDIFLSKSKAPYVSMKKLQKTDLCCWSHRASRMSRSRDV